ncbi:probable endonuclease 4 isoform X2 [Hyalella azteca]|uniref:Probable endonuclease 4 isoform X2 n=1 Tax=Hyalella azteca TaxID=294128 RepID=A0A8B7NKS0_HYAAZ|nr:probable endonuclease 4 isoform X2 [Hyalella azteca]
MMSNKSVKRREGLKPANDSSTSGKEKDTFMALPALATYPSLGPGPSAVPKTGRKYVGAHISAAGGIHNVFNNARAINAKSFAMFMRSQRQWIAKPFTDDHVVRYKEQSKSFASHLILPHGSYLMNVGSSKPDLLQKSRDLLVEELGRCHQLGIPHFNFHPGSCVGGSSRADCCRTIAESINIAHSKVPDVIVVLENMCKQGNTIGGDFHELRLIIELVDDRTRVGVCLDTCHAHNAGYDLSTEDGFNSMISDFEKIIGFQFLRGLHINDSKNEAGAHVDRHECIGKGHIGIEGMKRIMNCDLFNDLPLVLETPYTDDAGYAKEILMLEGLINSNNCEVKPTAVKGKRGRKKKEVQKVKEENLMEVNVPKGKRKRSSIDETKELRQKKSESCENNAKNPVKQEPVEVSEAKSTAQRGKKRKFTKAN